MPTLASIGVGDIYGPGFGRSGIADTHPGDLFWGDPTLHEGNLDLVTVGAPGASYRAGPFTLAQATVGLLLLLAFVYWSGNR
ncbi:MAG: hypothetical protein KGK34_07260 [Chloroflexota bacterium]|nr:hypothetical protein [Chloroflexota bacterium]